MWRGYTSAASTRLRVWSRGSGRVSCVVAVLCLSQRASTFLPLATSTPLSGKAISLKDLRCNDCVQGEEVWRPAHLSHSPPYVKACGVGVVLVLSESKGRRLALPEEMKPQEALCGAPAGGAVQVPRWRGGRSFVSAGVRIPSTDVLARRSFT
ncbi:hypothetical protein E2C01_030587 [Portunus trituberculatus]|uniref:Uncharacterized protein n=1 Tax=Portunus trituberculatus TaxID=210409 RepID=A0A5B7EW56_PORTR|nr:hypothetical protein [Portunus trituberculatus]